MYFKWLSRCKWGVFWKYYEINENYIFLNRNHILNFRSFAYVTIKDRLPGILTTVIDQFSRRTSDYHNKNELVRIQYDELVLTFSHQTISTSFFVYHLYQWKSETIWSLKQHFDYLKSTICLIFRFWEHFILFSCFSQEKAEDSKIIVGKLSQLKNEMQTNKQLKLLEDIYNDCEVWNEFIANMPSLVEKGSKGWFDVAWLSCECYLYRRMFSAINQRY